MSLEVTKLFHDCCQFDLKQVLKQNLTIFENNILDNECFTALADSIGSNKISEIDQEQFYQWMRAQFPTLFYSFEIWLRKHVALPFSSSTAQEASGTVYNLKIINNHLKNSFLVQDRSLMKMNNILNPTWIWLLTHNIPIVYLSADNSCTNLLERMSSVLVIYCCIIIASVYRNFALIFVILDWPNVGPFIR